MAFPQASPTPRVPLPAQVRRVPWLGLIVLALVVALAGGWVGQRAFTQALPRYPLQLTPREFGLEFQEVALHPKEGRLPPLTIGAWYVPGVRPATVVLCHGRGDSRTGLLPVTQIIHELGYTALAVEFRAHGTSDGTWSTIGAAEQRDLTAALDWLDAQAPAPIAAFGYSMGGCVVLSVAARDARIRGVVTEGAVGDLPWEIRRWYGPLAGPFLRLGIPWIWLRTGVTPWDAQPIRSVARIAPRPVLLIHSRRDRVVAFEGAERLYAAAAEPKELWILEHTRHIGGVAKYREEYQHRLKTFLERVFPPGADPA